MNNTAARNQAARKHRASRITDPFSVARGRTTLCVIASKIIQFGIAYGQAVRVVPEEVGLLVTEVTLLAGVFTAFCSSLEAQEETTAY
jgi:hypothetical protein